MDFLLAELVLSSPEVKRLPAEPAAAEKRPASGGEVELDDVICSLIESHLSIADNTESKSATAAAISEALKLLGATGSEARKVLLGQVIGRLTLLSDTAEAARLAIRVTEEFIDANRNGDAARLHQAAQAFVQSLWVATAALSFGSRCELVGHLLWGAATLGCLGMAKLTIDLLKDEIREAESASAGGSILQAAAMMPHIPQRYRLLLAIGLYQCAPTQHSARLDALQAIAEHNVLLPELPEMPAFCGILNQEIYQLRMDAE